MQSAPERIDEKPQIKESEAGPGIQLMFNKTYVGAHHEVVKEVKELEVDEPPSSGQKDVAPEDPDRCHVSYSLNN